MLSAVDKVQSGVGSVQPILFVKCFLEVMNGCLLEKKFII